MSQIPSGTLLMEMGSLKNSGVFGTGIRRTGRKIHTRREIEKETEGGTGKRRENEKENGAVKENGSEIGSAVAIGTGTLTEIVIEKGIVDEIHTQGGVVRMFGNGVMMFGKGGDLQKTTMTEVISEGDT
jgi:hypothetical protein